MSVFNEGLGEHAAYGRVPAAFAGNDQAVGVARHRLEPHLQDPGFHRRCPHDGPEGKVACGRHLAAGGREDAAERCRQIDHRLGVGASRGEVSEEMTTQFRGCV